jgi:hypothetical protein
MSPACWAAYAFVADSARKRAEATTEIIEAVDRFARPAYGRLLSTD